MNEVNVVSPERLAKMKRASADMHYQIAMGFDETDAEGTTRALVEKYPGVVLRVFAQRFINNLATLEAMDSLMRNWSGR